MSEPTCVTVLVRNPSGEAVRCVLASYSARVCDVWPVGQQEDRDPVRVHSVDVFADDGSVVTGTYPDWSQLKRIGEP